MQRTKSKILSILLSLVMLLSLLPTTALAAYPSPTSVSVDGGKRFSSPSQLYYKNNDDAGGFSGSDTDYNAHYDPNTGTLTLQGYEGGSITLDGDEREDLTIKLIGNNKITVNGATATATGIYVSTQKSNITITADSSDNGKLMINVATGSNDAVGIGSNIAATVPGNVTIKGYADVKIDAKTTVKNRSSRGIYAGKVGIEENAKVAITVIAANNTGGPHVYGIYAEGDVTINTAGEITVDASNAGSGDRLYSIGVKSGGNLILTKVGGMTVKWVKNNAGTYGAPLSPAKEFDPSKYDKILDEPNCTVIYTPKVVPPTASVGNVIIDGVKGSPITTAAEVKITLKNDTFASTLSGNWITNLPAGLSQSVSRTDDTHAKITVSGTPTATSSADLAIKIPAENLVTSTSDLDVTKNTNARYKIKASVAALGGSAGITGTAKYNEILTADTSAITGNTGTFLYQWKRNGTDITSATNSTYKLVEDDIGKTITVAITSSAESGTIVSSATATVEKADGPAAPSVTPVACTNSSNNDGKITGVNTTMEYSAASDFSTKTACTGSEITGLANGTYYVRVAETTTHKAGAAATVIVPAYTSGALGGSASISGTAKYDELLTAVTTSITGNTGTFSYQWKRNGADITSATNSTYKLVEDDIGKTITVAITSSAESGTIVSSATATVEKADGPAAPSVTPVACTNSSNNDGKITGVNTTMEYSAASDFSTKTACTGSEITGLANGTYYVRVAETTTHKAGAAATVIVPAYTSGTLGGSASISGTAKYDEVLTAVTSSITGNTGTFSYQWKRNGTDITSATNSTYKLVEDDIGKTITVAITSSVESGTIVSSPTAAVEKANGPAAPAAFTLSFTLNSDGTTFTATIPTVAGGEYSFDGTNYSATNTKADCAANTGYTGYVRIAATSTHEASTATSSTQTSPKLTVVTPTFTPNGVSGFTGTQSVTISCTTVGATIHYTTDGTEPTASSPVYSAALSLTSTTTVKAIAVKAGMNNSAIATATFTKYSGGGGGGGGSYTPSYTVSVDKTENGTITVSPKSASKGDTVTITVKPDKGYELEMLKALDKDGNALKLTEKNGKYTFTMPTGKVTVKGSFVEETPVQIFKDVPVDAYYYEAVKWAAEKGITGGVGNGRFAPNDPCTRAQIVTFLWRAAGSPTPKNMSSFADVPADAFYAKAVAWAVENGITGGTGDGKFSPNATCSRAQAVTFLYRAAGSPKVSGSAEFGDVATNAYYADAVAWAAKNGITGGIGDGLFGSGDDCTRAQIVTFLYRTYQGK